MRTTDFNYPLPSELIAQMPAANREESRLLVLDRKSEQIVHRRFPHLTEYLCDGDLLLLNDSRVIRARLRGVNATSAAAIEVLLLRENAMNDWWVMLRPGRRARIGARIIFTNRNGQPSDAQAKVVDQNNEGHRRLHFLGTPNILRDLQSLGEVPLPPYIRRGISDDLTADESRYQTIYAREDGSIAAPTAGLHFTENSFRAVRERGVDVRFVTLHVGLGTFAPVKTDNVSAHKMHEEDFVITPEVAAAINEAKDCRRRVIAVGTSTVRVLETVAARNRGRIRAGCGQTNLFIYPPYPFQIVDALLTNFHVPQSTLLMLVSAFAAPRETRGRELVLSAYAEAVRAKYRFFSYGDAMLLI
jgi:S-adenosylmethionine:tRNA ribosyltransferase-isomerase